MWVSLLCEGRCYKRELGGRDGTIFGEDRRAIGVYFPRRGVVVVLGMCLASSGVVWVGWPGLRLKG